MFGRPSSAPTTEIEDGGVRLDLSGPVLTRCLESLVAGSEAQGGIETYVRALGFKSALFQEVLSDEQRERMSAATFEGLCAFMSTVRRRVAPALQREGIESIRSALEILLDGAADTSTTDARIKTFCARFPDDRSHRWVRDLAAEILHNVDPERYPLMMRWVWDAKVNTGVLREIWYQADKDHRVIDVPDDYATFLLLRQELSQFLTDNGVYRDVPIYVDMLCAQVYAEYISSQGGSYLRADFSSPDDPLQYTRRLLGLDGIDTETGRTRFKALTGEAHVVEDAKLLN